MSKEDKNNKPTETEEVVYESENTDGEDTVHFVEKIKKLKAELENCRKEKQEYLDGWQRAKADFINFKKRSEEDKKEIVKYATEEFILEIIPALDSFEHAFRDKKDLDKSGTEWRQGIEFIYSQLKNVLTNHGVTEVNPQNEMFDPNLHHSIDVVGVEKEEDIGKIIDVIQKGYKLGDKIIRHPSVRVGEKR